MKTRSGFLLGPYLLMIFAALFAGCQPRSQISTATGIPPTTAPTIVAPAALATSTSAPVLQPLEIFLAGLDALNASPFSFSMQYTSLQKQKVMVPGQPASEYSILNATNDTGVRMIIDGMPNILVKRKVMFPGSATAHDMQAEMRLVDGGVFLLAGFVQQLSDLPSAPRGWIPLYGSSTPAYWPALDDISFQAIPSDLKGDAWSLISGANADKYRKALETSIDSVTQAEGKLEDGSLAQVITVTFKPDALRELMRWVDFDSPVNRKALSALKGSPLVIRLYLNPSGLPELLEQKIVLDVLNLDVGGLEGAPAGTALTFHGEFTTKVNIMNNENEQPISAPEPNQMAAFPAYTGVDAHFPFKTLEEFDQHLNQAASSGTMDSFWKDMTGVAMPLIFEETIVLLYHGTQSQVSWLGDWNDRMSSNGRRLGNSDTWFTAINVPLDARLEYQIQIDGQEPVTDPLNPNSEVGGLATKSVVFMPGYVQPDFIQARKDVAKGDLTENLTLDSRSLGYPVHYRVYMPPGYEAFSRLPVLYVTDGQDFLQFGKLDTALDNLIAEGKMRPVIAVLVDPRDVKTGENLRNEQFFDNPKFGDFIAHELVPVIDHAYRTNPDADARAILGASNGGYFSAYFALHHADTFHLIGMFSPSIWYNPGIIDSYRQTAHLPLKFFISTGTWSDANYYSALFKDMLEEMGNPVLYLECNEGHSYANWRGKFNQLLAYFFPPK